VIVDPDFCDHWKTRLLVGMLEGDEAAPIYVLRLWAHCQNRRQSTFDNLSPEALKALCRFPGNANKLEASLVTSGFVRREGKCVEVVGWAEYNSSLIAAWNNGAKGGRPPRFKPESNPEETQEKPTGKPLGRNPGVCDKRRVDEIGEEKNLEREKEVSKDVVNPFPNSQEFDAAARQYIRMRTAKHGPPGDPTIEAWWFSLKRFTVEEAIEILRFSTGAESKSPIVNGNHKHQHTQPNQQFSKAKKRDAVTEALEKLGAAQ
jgi:hypothetical protein